MFSVHVLGWQVGKEDNAANLLDALHSKGAGLPVRDQPTEQSTRQLWEVTLPVHAAVRYWASSTNASHADATQDGFVPENVPRAPQENICGPEPLA
mmetsp:Transcript_51714/g.99949  ORF Transcript_51714/g.99949 Transcript_51714/m.99949 type:complete len:96 (+) Transcript_51714:238-525(+)